IPHIVWQNLHPLLETDAAKFVAAVRKRETTTNLGLILPRAVERILVVRKLDVGVLADLFDAVRERERPDPSVGRQVLRMLRAKVHKGEIRAETLRPLRKRLAGALERERVKSGGQLREDASLLAATLGNEDALGEVRRLFARGNNETRLRALETLVAVRDTG